MKRVRVAPGKFVVVSQGMAEKAARVFATGAFTRDQVREMAAAEPKGASGKSLIRLACDYCAEAAHGGGCAIGSPWPKSSTQRCRGPHRVPGGDRESLDHEFGGRLAIRAIILTESRSRRTWPLRRGSQMRMMLPS